MDKIKQIAEELLKFTNARSIFLYGSRARADFYTESMDEIMSSEINKSLSSSSQWQTAKPRLFPE